MQIAEQANDQSNFNSGSPDGMVHEDIEEDGAGGKN